MGLAAHLGRAATRPKTTASPINVVESASQSTFSSLAKNAFPLDASMIRLALPRNALACAAAPNMKMAEATEKRSLEDVRFLYTIFVLREFVCPYSSIAL
jgi:uncharacterized Zn-finger protein